MNRPRAVGLLLAFLALLAFLPATRNHFVNYDDDVYVTQNAVVQHGITLDGIRWAFAGFHASNWHPLTWISHMADITLFRLNPAGHHFISILFHAANTFLLFCLLFRLTSAVWRSAGVAAAFAFHPLHVESVAWASERKDVLSTFFALLALWCYVRNKSRVRGPESKVGSSDPAVDGRLWTVDYLMALFFFACGLMSKPMVVTLPFVMLLVDFWPLGRVQYSKFKVQGLIREKIPFFILSAIFCAVTFLAQREHAVASTAIVPVPLRLENALDAYVLYLVKTIWPLHLCIFYPLPAHVSAGMVSLSAIVLAALSLAAWKGRREQPYLLIGWLWFLGTLVPVIGLVQVGSQAMADRYSYFPLVGIFIAVTWWMADLAERLPALKIPMGLAAAAVLATWIGVTERQLDYWRDSETLFRHALAVGGDDGLVRLNLGSALEEKGDFDGALIQYRRALELDPARHEVYNNLGKLLAAQGRFEEALPYCRDAVRLSPNSPVSHYGLGVVLRRLGKIDEALREFIEAARLDADYAPPRFQAGQILLRQGHPEDALAKFREALRIQPNDFPMLVSVARVMASDEDPRARNGAEALGLAQRAVTLDANALSLDALALAYAESGRFDDARRCAQQANVLASSLPPEEAARIGKHLESYQRNESWREAYWKF